MAFHITSEETSIIHFRPGPCGLPRLAVVLVALTVAFAARPAQARQVLLVSNIGNPGTVGEYDASTGATIDATFINGQGVHGGLYIDTGASVVLAKSTKIGCNFASTSDDDIFGFLTTS